MRIMFAVCSVLACTAIFVPAQEDKSGFAKLRSTVESLGGVFQQYRGENRATTAYIGLADPAIKDEDLNALAVYPEGIGSLDLAATSITDRGMPVFGKMTALRTLDLFGTQITGRGVANLTNCKRL